MNSRQFTLPDGQTTVVEWFESGSTTSNGTASKGTVAFLPALGVNAAYYRSLTEAWAARGYRIALVKMRGMQESSVRNVKQHNFGYGTVLTLDLATLLPLLAQEAAAAGQPFYLAGHSLGAQFALLHTGMHPHGIAGIIAVAAGSNYHASMPSWNTRMKRHVAVRFVRLTTQVLGFFPGDKLGFAGRQPRDMMLDWSYEALSGRYRIIGEAVDYNQALERLKIPVLLLSLAGDRLVPRSCADFLASKLQGAQITQVELHANASGERPYSHFSWTKRPDRILEQIDVWQAAQVCAADKKIS